MELIPEVHWTGVVDWSLRIFHGYNVPDGATYNAYVVMEESQPILIDSVKSVFRDEFMERLSRTIDIKKLKYMISLHSEPDHSGCLQYVHQANPDIIIICSPQAEPILKSYYPSLKEAKFKTMVTNDTLNFGKKSLIFLQTPMQHWPESSQVRIGNTLFSSDFFGQHLASTERWADEFDFQRVVLRAEDYIANILNPMRPAVKKSLEWVKSQKFEYLMPAHGLCFRGAKTAAILDTYQRFVDGESETMQIAVLYATMYGSTQRAASLVAQGIQTTAFKPLLLNTESTANAEIALQLFKSRAFAIGCPTLNGGSMPSMEAALRYAKALKVLNGKKCVVFGACCWAPNALAHIKGMLAEAKCEVIDEMSWILSPDAKQMEQLVALGEKLGKKV